MSKFKEDAGYCFIMESSNNTSIDKCRFISRHGISYAEFDMNIMTFDTTNRNGRRYNMQNIVQNLNTERIKHYLAKGGWFGEGDHPIQFYENLKYTPQRLKNIDMDRTAWKFLNPHVEGNRLVSKVQTDSGTPVGMHLYKAMIQGLIPNGSTRTMGSIQNVNGSPYVMVNFFTCIDWVLFQSDRNAEMTSNISTNDIQIESCVILPIHEMFAKVARSDVNTNFIMESFDLSLTDFVNYNPNTGCANFKAKEGIVASKVSGEHRRYIEKYLIK